MQTRVWHHLTTRLVHRVTLLGVLASLTVLAPLGALTPAAHAATGHIDEFNQANRPGIIQNSSSDPLGLTVGPDGNLWFTDAGEDLSLQGGAPPPRWQIGRFHLADGSLSFNPASDWFPNGEIGSVPTAITNSGDNNMWFSNFGVTANDVGVINSQGGNPLGSSNPFGVSIPASTLTDITLGPDNNMWFTMFGSGNIGHISRTGASPTIVTLPGGRDAAHPTATVTQSPEAITAGPDGNLWFTVQCGDKGCGPNPRTVDVMSPGGTLLHEYSTGNLPGLAGITPGPDGNLWFTSEGDSTANPARPNRPTMSGNGSIARITPAGVVTTFPQPAGASGFSPNAIVTGPDDNLWFIDVGGNAIWRFNPFASIATAYNKFPVPMPSAFSGNVQPTGIVAGPDGNIWFTENNNFGGLARLTIDPLISLSPSPANFGTHLPGSTTNMSVVATNTTSNTYTIQGAPSVSGPNAGEFTVSGCASGVLGPNLPASPNTCTMTAQFKPTATGTRSATLSFTATDLTAIPPTPLTVKVLLTGTGQSLNPTFGPSNAAFGDGFVGAVSRPVNFSLTNVTGVPIQVGSATFGAPNPNDFRIVGDTCTGATVPDQSSCTLSVAFAPTTLGARSSNLAVTLASGTKLGPSSLSGNGVAAPPGSNPGSGYWEVASDGGIFNFGSAKFAGSTGSINLNKPIVGMARTSTGGGYWLVATDGGIFAFGDAKFKGSTGSIHLNKPIVGMAPTPDGQGYWLVASDGGIFAFNAPFLGSTGSINLNKPIVGMVATPDGQGYWMVATDGGIFSFGSAKFFGSTGATHLNQPIVGMATTPDGQGYWLAATDGGIFNFGDAKFFGSTGAIHLNQPVVGIAATPDGAGYWMSATDGGIFNFGDAKFFGSTGSIHLNKPMVGLAAAT